MPVSIIDRLRQRARDKTETGESAYRKLIFFAARGEKHDVALLADAAEALGLDAGTVDADIKVIQNFDVNERSIAGLVGREKEFEAAGSIGAEIEELQQRRLKLLERQANGNVRLQTLVFTKVEIGKIQRMNPRLWAAPGGAPLPPIVAPAKTAQWDGKATLIKS